jgi:predicted RNase H-like HicB family nuclease
MLKKVKIIVEQHADGFVAYPVGLKGVVVAEGDTYEEALADAQSAIRFHIETFGPDVFDDAESASEVFVAETAIAV